LVGGKGLMALWYHFAIMFEALFILTTVDAGTRVGRFLIQAVLGQVYRPLGNTRSWAANMLASAILVSGWGYFMYQGVIDPLGGVNSLWPLFGIANQLLSVIALALGTTVLIKMGHKKRAWITLLPMAWVTTVTFTAGWQKIFAEDPRIGFLSGASRMAERVASGGLAGAEVAVAERTITNLRVDAVVAGAYLVLVGAIVVTSVWRWMGLWTGRSPLDLKETAPVWLSGEAVVPTPAPVGLKWLSGLFVLVMAMIRHLAGQGGAEAASVVTCGGSHGHGDEAGGTGENAGRTWADREERRFRDPRCC